MSRMTGRISFRTLISALFLGSLIPILVLVGLVVYQLQHDYLVSDARSKLISFVRADVESLTSDANLSVLAVTLGEKLRVLGADLFIKDADGKPVPPALGIGPWLDDQAHAEARQKGQGQIIMLTTTGGNRMVYITPILDPSGGVLGTVEASFSLQNTLDQLAALRRWLVLIIGVAAALAVILSLGAAELAIRPLKGLVGAADDVRKGNLSTRAALPAVLEARELASVFNEMLDRISDDLHRQTEQAETMRRFAADASHELRSPLTVFRNSVEVLNKAIQREDQVEIPRILDMMRREVDSMTALVQNLLFLARLDQAGEEPQSILHREPVELLPLLEEVTERVSYLARGQIIRPAQVKGEVPPLFVDREMIKRAINNLVENALNYTPAGKGVALSAELMGNEVHLLIQDEGAGIPEENLPRIFDRFFRGDASRNRGKPGTGLGLSIVASIVRAHGGRIQVASQLGLGTTVRIVLPVEPMVENE